MNRFALDAPQRSPQWSSGDPSAPSPYIDQRALSQVWYDALYRRRPGYIDRALQTQARTAPQHGAWESVFATQLPAAPASGDARTGAARSVPSAAEVVSDDEVVASDTASLQRIVRAALQRAVAQQSAGAVPALGTIRIDVPQADGSSIRLVVSQTPTTVGVVAVCAPAHRARLERCLAQMRDKLALAGIPLECKVHER